MRRLGDVLLTTPLVRALKQGLSDARIDMLVFSGSEGILTGNPDIDQIIAVPERPSVAVMAKLILQIWQRYDVALSTQTGDRRLFWSVSRVNSALVWSPNRRLAGRRGSSAVAL